MLLWCVFRLKGWLYQGDMISTLSYALIMLISLYYFIIYFKDYRYQPIIKSFNILVIFFTIYGVINIMFFDPLNKGWNVIPTDFFLQNILRSILPFYAFYAFTKQGYISKKWICYAALIVLLTCIPRYYIEESKMLLIMQGQGMLDVDGITNNSGYLFSALIPLFCFWTKKPIVQYAGYFICIYFLFSCMKRGAILVGFVSLGFIFYNLFKSSNSKQKMIFLMLSLILIYLSFEYFLYMADNSDYFVQRLQDTKDGNTSSRSVLYDEFWNMFLDNTNPFSILFGLGADATIRYGKNYAHNDWLEIVVDHGIVGILIFSIFWYRMYKFLQRAKVYPILYIALGSCLLQLFAKTFFSMSINDMEFYTVLVLGYSTAIVTYPRLAEHQELT